MKRAYWFAPVVVLVVFIFLYFNFLKGVEEKDRLKKEAIAQERRVREEKNEALKKKLAELQRLELAEKNRKIAEEKARKEAEETKRSEMEYQLQRAQREAIRLAKVVEDLKKDLDSEKEGKQKAETTIAATKKERSETLDLVTKVEANRKNLQDVLTKIEQADKARADAAAAAVAGKNKDKG